MDCEGLGFGLLSGKRRAALAPVPGGSWLLGKCQQECFLCLHCLPPLPQSLLHRLGRSVSSAGEHGYSGTRPPGAEMPQSVSHLQTCLPPTSLILALSCLSQVRAFSSSFQSCWKLHRNSSPGSLLWVVVHLSLSQRYLTFTLKLQVSAYR